MNQKEREGGVEGLAAFVAMSGSVSLRREHTIPPSTQPLLSSLPKVELFSRPPRPSFSGAAMHERAAICKAAEQLI